MTDDNFCFCCGAPLEVEQDVWCDAFPFCGDSYTDPDNIEVTETD